MTIETEHQVGDEIFAVHNSQIRKVTVLRIFVTVRGHAQCVDIKYEIDPYGMAVKYETVEERCTGKTAQEVVNKLLEAAPK